MRLPLLAAGLLLLAAPAAALDRFEIQVYQADIDDPGQASLEVHFNQTLRGLRSPEYPGAIPPDRLARLTLEPALGVADWLELGGYLQFAAGPGGTHRFGGFKVRAKMVLPEHVQRSLGLPVFLGLNAEVGRIPKAFEPNGWANEFRPIVGWRDDSWLVVVNPIFGYALTGPDRFKPELEPCGKIAWNTQRGFSLGAEYYAGLGAPGDGFLPWRSQAHLLFAVLDLVPPAAQGGAATHEQDSPWELNLGAGLGLTAETAQHLVLKVILGRSF